MIALHQVIPLCKDISLLDNEWLTQEATEKEILQAIK